MTGRHAHQGFRCLVLGVCLVWALPAACAQEPAAGQELQQLRERLSRVEKELEQMRQRAGGVPADPKAQRVVMLLESPYLGSIYYGSPNGDRFLAAKLLLVNLTPRPLVIKRTDLELDVDGQTRQIEDIPQNLRYHSVPVGRQHVQLQTMSPFKELRIGVGGSVSTWIFFPKIAQGNNVPKMTLSLKLGDAPQTLDVNAEQLNVLGLEVTRIGPRKSLALFTISGELNAINVGALVAELDQLNAQKIGRAVITWSDAAAPVSPQLQNWLQMSAMSAGRGEVSQAQFPAVPVTIGELHLAQMPLGEGGNSYRSSRGPGIVRVHKTTMEAIGAALRTAYEALPRDELVTEIEEGDRFTRAAALACGAGRLGADKLPLILKYADDKDPLLQQAALGALQHFGEPPAIAKLVEYTRKGVEPLSGEAIASLAGSRYEAAHQALLEVLRNEPPASKKLIVQVLAQHPRPIWSDAIYEFARDAREGLNLEALRALQQVGHPKLVEMLQEGIQSSDQQLRDQAFTILVTRTDRESEEIALTYTLGRLKDNPPDANMLALLTRTKDQRAIPLLLGQFDRSRDKVALIQTLTAIGDQQVADVLLEKYEGLQPHEKSQVLNLLHRLKNPRFKELAKAALYTSDSSLASMACQALVDDGGAEAVKILIEALEKSPQQQAWVYISNALGMIGTPEARQALIKSRDNDPAEKRQFAVNALLQIRQRSPGFQFAQIGQQQAQQKQWKEAVQSYTKAIEVDPELPEAYVGRADCHIRQEKYAEAGKDFAKALELDPYNSQAVTGVCIVMAIEGKYAEAVTRLEASRDKFPRDAMFAYNSACVYGRAVEQLKAKAEAEDREKLLPQYTRQALSELGRSVKLGFGDLNWMKQDPDLKSLHDEAEFQQLSKGEAAEEAPDANEAEDVLP